MSGHPLARGTKFQDRLPSCANAGAAFYDQVLFLKHNLNARAIASLKGNVASIESDIAVLIREMEASIREANRFIDAMNVEQVS